MGSFVDPSLAGFLFTSAVLIGCGNLLSGGMARLVNLDAPPQVSTPLQGLARNFRRLDVDARAPCDPASRCHAWSHPRGLDDGDDHPGALFAGHTRPQCDRLWHPPQAGCCRWCDWQPSRSRVCRTDRRTKQRLPCPHNDGRPFRDHSADVKPICYGVRTLERDDHSSALERCYRIVLPTSQSDDLPGRVDFLYRFFGWVLMAVAALAGGWDRLDCHMLFESRNGDAHALFHRGSGISRSLPLRALPPALLEPSATRLLPNDALFFGAARTETHRRGAKIGFHPVSSANHGIFDLGY